jgi:hypothetical protein
VRENSKISIAVERNDEFSRKAATECSPRRKPWVKCGISPSPEGAKETFSRSLFSPSQAPSGASLQKARFVSGHDFSRAAKPAKKSGFSRCRKRPVKELPF